MVLPDSKLTLGSTALLNEPNFSPFYGREEDAVMLAQKLLQATSDLI